MSICSLCGQEGRESSGHVCSRIPIPVIKQLHSLESFDAERSAYYKRLREKP